MTDAEVIAAIRKTHRKTNMARIERDPGRIVRWDEAWIDPGGTIFGPGPYLKVPVQWEVFRENEDWRKDGLSIVVRVYPPERLRKKLAKQWRAVPRGVPEP